MQDPIQNPYPVFFLFPVGSVTLQKESAAVIPFLVSVSVVHKLLYGPIKNNNTQPASLNS